MRMYPEDHYLPPVRTHAPVLPVLQAEARGEKILPLEVPMLYLMDLLPEKCLRFYKINSAFWVIKGWLLMLSNHLLKISNP